MDQFDDRVKALYKSQQSMCAPKKWKNGKRAGQIRIPGVPLQFTREQLRDALWERVGLNATGCPYCNAAIDILSLTLDHTVPRRLGGQMTIGNMDICCVDCNNMKRDMTHEAFVKLREFMLTLSTHDQTSMAMRLKGSDVQLERIRWIARQKAAEKQSSTPPPSSRPPTARMLDFEPF